jgi:DUF1365 family protein
VGGGVITSEDSALYVGAVAHKRLRPKPHSLRYGVFSMLVDLDRLDELSRRLKWFSLDRFNLFSLYARDFGPRDGTPLAAFARLRAAAAGLEMPAAKVRMLFYPRLLGYAFNPITVYYLDDADGRTVMLIFEVRNTFGEHHFYDAVIAAPGQGEIKLTIPKNFYVSPFNAVTGSYRFTIRLPDAEVFTGIALSDGDGPLVNAYFTGERQVLSDRALLRLAVAFPLMTLKVIAGIHWEALKLWRKGVPLTLGQRRSAKRAGAPRQASGIARSDTPS